MKTLKRITLVLFALVSLIPLAGILLYSVFTWTIGFNYPDKLMDGSLDFVSSVRDRLL